MDAERKAFNRRQRCLVVDDEALIRWSLAERLQDDGWFVLTVADLAGARQALLGEPFDLVICDVRLPDGNGIDLLGELATAGSSTPVLYITAHGDSQLRADALAAGAVDMIDKPFDLDALAERARATVAALPTGGT